MGRKIIEIVSITTKTTPHPITGKKVLVVILKIISEKEKLAVSTEIISADTLINYIYKGESLPQNNRFLQTENGGVFKYFDIKEIDPSLNKKFYLTIKVADEIVGLSELEKDPLNNKNIWIKFISIDPAQQGKGYATKLAKEIFDFAQREGYSLEASSYSEKGFEKLRPVLERLAKEYSVLFINKGRL